MDLSTSKRDSAFVPEACSALSLAAASRDSGPSCTIRHEREKLSGRVEVDEFFVGGQRSGKRSRGAENKIIVAVGVER